MATTSRKPLAHVLVRPPNRPSNGAQTIRESLGDVCRLSRMDPIARQYRYVINWGNSTNFTHNVTCFNAPAAVGRAANKLTTFLALREYGVPIPPFFTNHPPVDKNIYLARTSLTGSGGEGIVVIRPGDAIPEAPLYVKYIRKTVEFRVHVAFGEVIFAQQKKRKSDNEQTADQKLIRNYDNGWVFCPVEIDALPASLMQAVVPAVAALGLDFGAVDCVMGRDDGAPYVLEINTAPGLESPGLIAAYTEAFQARIK